MVTENVNVRFRESGARVIKRRIDQIGQSANSATRGIFLLQRALFVIGGAGIARGLQRYADALTAVENRLRLTTTSTAQLEQVQDRLFDVARRSRSDFIATAEVYNRIALSARNLGAGQEQILDVTETLQKAAIISGASAREANAALVQLGQGLASDRLSGDELRSVLEQLPFVADIIVDYLNDVGTFGEVTRGSLRSLGREGKLTADIVFRAIQASQQNVDRLFEGTNATIDQAFGVAKTNLLDFIDAFDDATGASSAFANLIIKVSENLDKILFVAGLAGAALLAVFTGKVIAGITAYIAKLRIAGGALARYRSIQAGIASAQAASTAAVAKDTASRVANLQAITARSAAQVRSAQIEFAEAQAAFANGRARDAQTGRFISSQVARDRLTAATIRLSNAERVNLGLTNSLTAARTASIVADNKAAAAAANAGAAQAARAGILARLSATFPLLAGAARLALGAVSALFAVFVANPIGAIIAAIVVATSAILTFGDKINVLGSNFITLKDLAVAAFQIIFEKAQELFNNISRVSEPLIETVAPAFKGIFEVAKSVASLVFDIWKTLNNRTLGLFFGAFQAIVVVWKNLGPVFKDIATIAINGLVQVVEGGINGIIEAVESLFEFIGSAATLVGIDNPFENLFGDNAVNLERFKGEVTGALGSTGAEASAAFVDGFSRDFVGQSASGISSIIDNITDPIVDRARRNATIRQEDIAFGQGLITDSDPNAVDSTGTGGSGGSANARDFAGELAALQQRIDLERQYGIQKEITNNVLSIEKAIKRDLSSVEAEQVASATALLEISKIQGEVLQASLGPQETLRLTQAALNELFAEGAINLETYNQKLRETQIAADQAANTLGGGFRAAVASSIQSAGEFGATLGDFVVGAAGKASDAIVDFAKTGQVNIRAFFQDLFAQLLKLAAQRLLLQFLGGFLGIPGAGLAGASQGGSILPSFAGGGSLMPTGPGSTDSQVVAFNKRPDERVDILTPGQQAAQRNNMNGSNSQPVSVTSQTNVAAVFSPSDVVGAFDEEGDTVMVNMIQRNASVVRQIINGG